MTTMTRTQHLSRRLFEAVMLSDIYQYELAAKIGMHPTQLNRALHGAPVSETDRRWRKLAHAVGVPDDLTFATPEAADTVAGTDGC